MTDVTVAVSTAVVVATSSTSATVTAVGAAEATVFTERATITSALQQVDTIGNPSWIQMNTTSSPTMQTGRIGWDVDFQTLQIGVNGNANLQVGQEFHILVQNTAEETITHGQVVMGALDNQGRLRIFGQSIIGVELAVADGSVPSKLFLGIATVDIAKNQRGVITTNGVVNDVPTNAFTAGDILWANPAVPGGLTLTPPVAPNLKLPVAVVLRKAGSGSIYVRMTQGSTLGVTDDNVQIDSPQDGDVLTYNGTTGVWENKQP
jgi:hypothetical protein